MQGQENMGVFGTEEHLMRSKSPKGGMLREAQKGGKMKYCITIEQANQEIIYVFGLTMKIKFSLCNP
ncbi:hypothetical protein U27_06986 [Candidatus Vecturithrix granuli]|uniref:Uncharacterized protein n=1 Tax=Vecturithrix granuli TaxID=1499967 RepID=A0A081C5Z4_VECG1|nr:hypothetical protein U27_06986 [Candidatus Vecturithrix granuli]